MKSWYRKHVFAAFLCMVLATGLALNGCGGGGGNDGGGGGGNATATLSWTAPDTNADATSLTDLAGFKIYVGNSSGNYNLEIRIVALDDTGLSCSPAAQPGAECAYVIEGLAAGTYYFAVTAYDTSDNESSKSNEASKAF